MASHLVCIRTILLVVLLVLTAVEPKRTRQQMRPTRGFHEMELGVTRGFGKRTLDFIDKPRSSPDIENRKIRGLSDMPYQGAPGYGKRAPEWDAFKNFIVDWYNLERRMKNMRMAQLANAVPVEQ